MASFYMQWHGPNGLRKIANKVRFMSQIFMEELTPLGVVFAND
jgi:glycine cleavage system pyridoxal-binding protein P